MFGKKSPQESSYNNPELGPRAIAVTPLIAIVIVGLACGCMVGAYFLGFRAGRTTGLELALASNASQVVRSPVAKSLIQTEDNVANENAEVYAKLKEPAVVSDTAPHKPAEVSKEVKEFLEPTPPAPQKGSAASAPNAPAKSAVQEKKQADTVAIEKALNDAKKSDSKSEEVVTQKEDIEASDEFDFPEEKQVARLDEKSVKVIGSVGQKSTKTSVEAAPELKRQVARETQSEPAEDFREPPSSTSSKEKPFARETSKKQTAQAPKESASKLSKRDTVKPQVVEKIKTKETAALNSKLEKSSGQPTPQSLPSGWYSQVAAPRSIGEAQGLADKLRASGFKARIETAQVRDEKYYRVVVGPEASRLSADQTLMRLKKTPAVRTEPFIRMVR